MATSGEVGVVLNQSDTHSESNKAKAMQMTGEIV